ncbi:MAG TPA: FHA domain-containing protein [Kofleriaceae bacterium]|nr:FHA domain-containing protein [Kofleriaceae bacterium]
MDPVRVHCVLDVRGGPSRRVGPGGVLIGRQSDCDIVATDPSVSRRHALVRLTGSGAEVVPLGRSPVDVNGAPTDRPRDLVDGDELRLPGLILAVAIAIPRPEVAARAAFALERTGAAFGIAHTPFVIGGSDTDDLIVKRWPARVLSLHLAQGELFVELHAGDATCNGAPLEVDAPGALAPGDTLACRGESFVVRAVGAAATTALGGGELPTRVAIELLPRGGRVVFSIGGGDRAVYLADRRFDLVVALARPPGTLRAGEFVSDDALRTVVWPRRPSVSRPEINMLISRCRRDLVEAGLAGPRLIERAPGGGGTRLALAPGAEVVMKG